MVKDNSKLNFTLIFFSVALVLCFGLNLDIFKDYAFLDDYEFIYTAGRDDNFKNIFIENGRPLFGLWCEFFYGSVFESISQLKWSRVFATFFCVLFSAQIFRYLISIGLKRYESAIFSILVLALPTFTVYYSWSSTAQIPMLLVLNFYAGQLLLKDFKNHKRLSINTVFAFIIVITSMFMYQSTATIFMLPFLFTTVKSGNFNIKVALYFVAFTFLCFLAYLISFKLIVDITGLETANRASVNLLSLPKRIINFFLVELRILIKNSGFLILPKWSLLLGIITFCGFFILKLRQKKSIIFLSALVLILLFCYAPNILSGQSYFSLRTIATTAIIILFYQFWFLRYICIKYNKAKIGLLVLPVFLLILSSFNQKEYVAGLQHKEYKILKKAFQDFDINQVTKLAIIRPNYGFLQELGYLKNGFSGEFGNLSSVKDWVPNHFFCQVKWEKQKIDNKLEVFPVSNINVYTKETYKEEPNTSMINLIEIFKKMYSE